MRWNNPGRDNLLTDFRKFEIRISNAPMTKTGMMLKAGVFSFGSFEFRSLEFVSNFGQFYKIGVLRILFRVIDPEAESLFSDSAQRTRFSMTKLGASPQLGYWKAGTME